MIIVNGTYGKYFAATVSDRILAILVAGTAVAAPCVSFSTPRLFAGIRELYPEDFAQLKNDENLLGFTDMITIVIWILLSEIPKSRVDTHGDKEGSAQQPNYR
ncbi:MAG: hypothetical protein ACLTER_11330 [Ruminococcus sp.]